MAIAHSYIRFSSKKQATGDSERRQDSAFERFCKEGGHNPSRLNFRDLGVSAFRGKNAKKGALAGFFEAIKEGIVKPHEILAIESLDRLSRLEPFDANGIFRDIVNAGITIVTLSDRQTYSRETIRKNPALLFIIDTVFIRAHEESQTKSMRVLAAHAQARKNLDKVPFNRRCPNWIKWDDRLGKFVLIPERCEVVRRMIRMSLDGYGTPTISRTLNREGVPVLSYKTTSRRWEYSTVRHILTSRTLIGEYQPRIGKDGERIAAGDPVKGYYPALLTEPEFYRLQSAMQARTRCHVGRNGKATANLFGRVLVSGHDGGTMTLAHKRKNSCTMTSMQAIRGLSKHTGSFPYHEFEAAFLRWVRELNLHQIGKREPEDRTAELDGRLAELRERLAAMRELMKTAKVSTLATLAGAASDLEAEEAKVQAEKEGEQAKKHTPTISAKAIGEWIDKAGKLQGDEKAALRSKIKSAIHAICQQIRVYIFGTTVKRILYAHVLLTEGSDRYFCVTCERGKPATTESDNLKWIGYQTPEKITASMFQKWAEAELAGTDKP